MEVEASKERERDREREEERYVHLNRIKIESYALTPRATVRWVLGKLTNM